MIPQRSRFSTFNDGVLWVCDPDEEASDFGAVRNTTKKEELKKINKLAYKEMSKRDQDLDFAESQGRVLSIKVKCRLWPKVNKMHQILIDKILYGIINLDEDRNSQEMYLYLEEVRRLS